MEPSHLLLLRLTIFSNSGDESKVDDDGQGKVPASRAVKDTSEFFKRNFSLQAPLLMIFTPLTIVLELFSKRCRVRQGERKRGLQGSRRLERWCVHWQSGRSICHGDVPTKKKGHHIIIISTHRRPHEKIPGVWKVV
eukprot:scaffold2716_cov179-Amphora_coffeaeformis.AAC.21